MIASSFDLVAQSILERLLAASNRNAVPLRGFLERDEAKQDFVADVHNVFKKKNECRTTDSFEKI